MVDSHAFHLTVDAIGSLERDTIHEIGSHASPSTYGSRIALTFFKPNVIDNFNADSINAPCRVECFFIFLTLCTFRSFIDYILSRRIHREKFLLLLLRTRISRASTRQNDTIGSGSIRTKTNDVFIVFLENWVLRRERWNHFRFTQWERGRCNSLRNATYAVAIKAFRQVRR